MSANLAAFLYLVSGVLFIMALRGLSHPTTSRQGNTYGMIGMGIAIVTTLALAATPVWRGWGLIVLGLAIGGGIGAVIARRIAMTRCRSSSPPSTRSSASPPCWWPPPPLCAGQPSASAKSATIHGQALVEMALGVAIGAITFTGSIIAFLKLDGRMRASRSCCRCAMSSTSRLAWRSSC
jgi:NAD(P) transhydrogenase subunit beta